ncbi:MAG: class I SAM-dependent methyltransferase [Caldilineaceae bacterium]|nr:class I SAM-dependent methyltransferase [Caldilineaceae bacterium]
MNSGRKQDAFGLLLADHLAGEDCSEFIERDDGYLMATDNLPAYFAPYNDWPPRMQQAMEFVHGRVLDVGVGAGRFALYLQDRGHEVVGIDVSPGALEICRKRGVKNVKQLPFHRVDASLGTFDTVLMMGNNFGLLANPRRAKWMLRRLKNITSQDARIVAESLDIYGTDKPEHLGYHDRNRQRGRMAGEIRLRVRYRQLIGDWFDYLMVSQAEMQEIVEGTGWRVAEFIGGTGGQYVGVIEKVG